MWPVVQMKRKTMMEFGCYRVPIVHCCVDHCVACCVDRCVGEEEDDRNLFVIESQ